MDRNMGRGELRYAKRVSGFSAGVDRVKLYRGDLKDVNGWGLLNWGCEAYSGMGTLRNPTGTSKALRLGYRLSNNGELVRGRNEDWAWGVNLTFFRFRLGLAAAKPLFAGPVPDAMNAI